MFSNPLPVRHMSPGAQQDLRSQRGSARGTANCGQNSHLIGLSFKYLTQDNHRQEKRLPFLVLNFFKQIRETAVKLRFSPQGMQDKTCYGTKKVKIQKLDGWWLWDGGSPNFGNTKFRQSGPGKLSISPVCDSWTLWERPNCPKVRYVFAGLPPGTQLRRGGPWPPWCDRGGGGDTCGHPTPHTTDQSWHQLGELHRGPAVDNQGMRSSVWFVRSDRGRGSLASRVRQVSSSVWQCRVSVCDIWSQPQSPPCHTLTHHTLCQLSQNILYTRLCLSWWASQLQAAPHSDIWGLSFVWLGSMSIPTLSGARFE